MPPSILEFLNQLNAFLECLNSLVKFVFFHFVALVFPYSFQKRFFKIIIVNNLTIKQVVQKEIEILGKNANLNHINTFLVTDMDSLFKDSDFNGDISKWDVSRVKYMDYMFYNSLFNGDISQWNTQSLQFMQYMFSHSQFNQDISNWNVENVETMKHLFSYSVFNGDINKWNVRNVEDASFMFAFSLFNRIIDRWKFEKLQHINNMFESSQFNQNISTWYIPTLRDATEMFKNSQFDNRIYFLKTFTHKGLSLFHLDTCLKDFFYNSKFSDFESFFYSFGKYVNKPYSILHYDRNFNFFENKDIFNKLIDFINSDDFVDMCKQSHFYFFQYLDTHLPLFCLDMIYQLEDTPSLNMKLKKAESFFVNIDDSYKLSEIISEDVANLDILLIFLISIQRKTSLNNQYINKVISIIFTQSFFDKMFDGLNTLLALTKKDLKKCLLFQDIVDKFFDFECLLILNQNQLYLDYLKTTKKQFSDFWSYYSEKQKTTLTNLKPKKKK